MLTKIIDKTETIENKTIEKAEVVFEFDLN